MVEIRIGDQRATVFNDGETLFEEYHGKSGWKEPDGTPDKQIADVAKLVKKYLAKRVRQEA